MLEPDVSVYPQDDERTNPSVTSALHRLRVLSVFINVLIPYAVYLMMLAATGTLVAQPLLALAGSGLVLGSTYWLATHVKQVKWAFVFGLVETMVVMVAWAAWRRPDEYFWGFPFLSFMLLYRLIRLFAQPLLTVENRTALRMDCIALFVFVPLYAMVQTGGVITRNTFVLLTVAGIVGRVYILWEAERMESGTRGRRLGFGLVLLVLVSVGFGLYGGRVLELGLMFLVLAVFFLVSPLVLILPSKYHVVLRMRPLVTQQNTGAKHLSPPSKLPVAPNHSFVYALYAIAVVVAITSIAVYILRRPKREESRRTQVVNPQGIQRTWIKPKRALLRFTATTDPLRLRYQAWLKEQHMRGETIQPYETAKHYEKRLQGTGTQSDATHARPGLRAYEDVRYGEPHPPKNDGGR